MSEQGETYPCMIIGCTNMITFTERDRAFFISKGFVDPQGNPTKPRKCKKHRLEAKARTNGQGGNFR